MPEMSRLGNRYSVSWDLSFSGKALITKQCWSEFIWHNRAATRDDRRARCSPAHKEGFEAADPCRPQELKLLPPHNGGLST